jgi:hypothetical protein
LIFYLEYLMEADIYREYLLEAYIFPRILPGISDGG